MSTESPTGTPPTPAQGPGNEPIITRVHDANSPQWSRRKAVLVGAAVGAFFGVIFFGAYAGTSAWICSARLDCGHWAPITITAAVGAMASTIAGATAGYVLHKMYRLFKVA